MGMSCSSRMSVPDLDHAPFKEMHGVTDVTRVEFVAHVVPLPTAGIWIETAFFVVPVENELDDFLQLSRHLNLEPSRAGETH